MHINPENIIMNIILYMKCGHRSILYLFSLRYTDSYTVVLDSNYTAEM